MAENILFTEKQKFNQWWLWAFLLGINGLTLFGLIKQLVFRESFGSKPMGDMGLILFTMFLGLFTYLFTKIELITQITNEGIAIKFSPFHRQFKFFKWSEISKCYIRTYSPLKDYGGWGIKYGSLGIVYNVSGNQGIQLEFLDNRNILIGTNKPDEVNAVLRLVTGKE